MVSRIPLPRKQAEIDAQRKRVTAMIRDKDEWSPPARDIEVQVEHEPLVVKNQRMPEPTLEEEPNSRPQQPGPHSMRASDMDPLSGTAQGIKVYRSDEDLEAAQGTGSGAAIHRFDEPTRLSLYMVASPQSPLPFRPARSL